MAIFHPVHLLIVGLVALLMLGPKRLPELAKSVGEAMKELRSHLKEEQS